MKKIVTMGGLIFSLLYISVSFAKPYEESLDQIIAVVNDEVVTTSELNHSLTAAKMQIAQENAPTPPEKVLQKQVLDQLINKKLQLQIAKQAGVEIPDEDLNRAITKVAEQNHMTVNELYQRLSAEGMTTDEYRREMRDQLTLTKLQQQEVVSKITITPQEVDRFIKSHPLQANNEKEYRIEDILIPVSDTPSPAEINAARQRAQTIFTKLSQGQNFRSIAQAESAEKHALQGGDLGWRRLAEVPTAFADKVIKMKPTQMEGPIQTSNGFHIIRLAEVRSTNGESAGAPTRKDIENLLLERKFEEAVHNWVMKLRSQAFIAMNDEKPKSNASESA